MTLANCSYIYFMGVNIRTVFGGDALSGSNCDHILLRHCTIDGTNTDTLGSVSPNTISFMTSQYIYIEQTHVTHSSSTLVYLSACQYGHILESTLDSGKGVGFNVTSGSAYWYFERNRINAVSGIGFILGGTTNLDYDFITPWVHYDTYDIRIDNNVFSNISHEAFLANGSYNALIAYNTFYKVGFQAPTLFIIGIGNRTCAFDQSRCKELLDSGAWGTVHIYQSDDDAAWIPNKHLYFFNNMWFNPVGSQTLYGGLSVWGERKALSHAKCPNPATADDDLEIKGNFGYNGDLSKPIGLSDTSGCQDTNPTCNKALIYAENAGSVTDPNLVDPEHGNFHPASGSLLFGIQTQVIANFGWSDIPGIPKEPQGDLSNQITTDFDGVPRSTASDAPGAFSSPASAVRDEQPIVAHLSDPFPNPSTSSSLVTLTLDNMSFVSLGVYDLLGRVVESVIDRTLQPGNYPIPLPTQSLENGVYYIRVQYGHHISAKQLIVAH
jgi:hypothetical protein